MHVTVTGQTPNLGLGGVVSQGKQEARKRLGVPRWTSHLISVSDVDRLAMWLRVVKCLPKRACFCGEKHQYYDCLRTRRRALARSRETRMLHSLLLLARVWMLWWGCRRSHKT